MLPIYAETVTQFSAPHFTAHYSEKKKSWKNYRVLTLALPISIYYMSPLSLRARISFPANLRNVGFHQVL